MKWDRLRLAEKIDEIKTVKSSPGSVLGDGMPHGTDIHDLSDYMAKLDALERKLEAQLDRKTAAYHRISDRIDCMESAAENERVDDEKLRNVLRMKYLRGWSFERIAVEYDKDWRTVLRWHGMALKIF